MPDFIKRMNSPKCFFALLVFLTILVIISMLLPDYGSLLGKNILILWMSIGLSGLGLVILTYRQKISGKVKTFLLLSGFSAVGFVLGVVLHNLFYALGILAENLAVLNTFLAFLEGSFFLIAVILCPIGLLVGLVGTIVLWGKINSL